MIKHILLITVTLLAFSSSKLIHPYDLVEEAEKQLQELISIIQTRIYIADDDIQDLYNDFRSYARDERYDSHLDIQQEYQLIEAQVSQIKILAQSAGKDISSCTNIREETLQRDVDNYRNQITECIDHVLDEGQRVTRDAKYYVDIVMNKVHNLENQFRSCNGNFICISPLLTQIELYKINLVQDIRNEIYAVDDLLADLKSSSKTCADNGVSAYVAQSYIILSEITTCANAILG